MEMLSYWSFKKKAAAFLIFFALYVYLIMFIKTIYMRRNKLDKITAMTASVEKQLNKVQEMDQRLAKKLEQLEGLYEDY